VAVIAVSALRQRLAAAVEALTSPSPWRESRWSFDLFPSDPGQYAHLAFAVGAQTTAPDAPQEMIRHKRGADGALVTTSIAIAWTYRLRADRQVADYDAALDAEAVLVRAITGASQVDVHFIPTELRRRVVGDGAWMFGTVSVDAVHRLQIQ
jgi:hypothetical protein